MFRSDMYLESCLETTFMALIAMWCQKIPSLRLTLGSCFLEQYSATSPGLFLKHTGTEYGVRV